MPAELRLDGWAYSGVQVVDEAELVEDEADAGAEGEGEGAQSAAAGGGEGGEARRADEDHPVVEVVYVHGVGVRPRHQGEEPLLQPVLEDEVDDEAGPAERLRKPRSIQKQRLGAAGDDEPLEEGPGREARHPGSRAGRGARRRAADGGRRLGRGQALGVDLEELAHEIVLGPELDGERLGEGEGDDGDGREHGVEPLPVEGGEGGAGRGRQAHLPEMAGEEGDLAVAVAGDEIAPVHAGGAERLQRHATADDDDEAGLLRGGGEGEALAGREAPPP